MSNPNLLDSFPNRPWAFLSWYQDHNFWKYFLRRLGALTEETAAIPWSYTWVFKSYSSAQDDLRFNLRQFFQASMNLPFEQCRPCMFLFPSKCSVQEIYLLKPRALTYTPNPSVRTSHSIRTYYHMHLLPDMPSHDMVTSLICIRMYKLW